VTVEPPYGVVITGSTRGVGRALAERFLAEGDRVVICSRDAAAVEAAVAELGARFGPEAVRGRACDVASGPQVRALADYAAAELGRTDIWINNAGTNAYRYGPLMDQARPAPFAPACSRLFPPSLPRLPQQQRVL